MATRILDRVSYHAVYDDSILSALQFAHGNGFSGLQVADECPHLSFERLTTQDREAIKVFIAQTGTNLSLHAPDQAVSLFVTSPLLLQGIERYYEALVGFAAELGVHVLTVHLGSPVMFRTDTIPEEPFPRQDQAIYGEYLRSGLEYLTSLTDGSLALCVENYRMDLATLELLEPYLIDGRLYLCWDIAKSRDDPAMEEYFWRHLGAVKQVHFHDYWDAKGTRRSHRAIGSGLVDFSRYLPRLEEADIPDFCIEVRPREKALESLCSLKRILDELE